MKMRLFVSFLVLSLVLSSIIVAAEVAPTSKIKIILLNQDPDPVKQGEVVEVRFKIENEGIETESNVKIKIIPRYPFSLYTGVTTYDIGKLRAGQSGADSAIIDYKLLVDEDAIEGDNEIEIEVRVDGGFWQKYSEDEFFIDIEDYDFPDIKLYIKRSDIQVSGQKGNIVLEIANTDVEDIKFLELTLMDNENYDILSTSNYVYIGDVDSDDTETEEFEIFVESGASEVILPIKLAYQDTNGKKYEKDFAVKLKLFNQEELKRLGLKKSNNAWIVIIVALALAIGGYFYWKRKRR